MASHTIEVNGAEFVSVFVNNKRFIAVPVESHPIREGDLLNITAGKSKAIKRIATYVERRDVLIAGDMKEIFVSVRPLTNAEKHTLSAEAAI